MQQRPFLLALTSCCAVCASLAPAQTAPASVPAPNEAAKALLKARAMYYTPVDHGLQSFHCDVHFDWKDFMEKASHQPIAETDPRLAYLRTVKLSVDDDLRGKGDLHWAAATPAPEGNEDAVNRMRDGLQQLWAGFFQSWNGFVTGDMVTMDPSASAEPTASGGYRVSAHNGAGVAEEQFNHNLVLESISTKSATIESTMLPHFDPSAQGLLLTGIHSSYRQPPAAAPVTVDMNVKYAVTNSFGLPSTLSIAAGPAHFDFTLQNCTVKTQLTAQ